MRLPRFVHRLYAWLLGYFWLPCPACGQHFGGHQARVLPHDVIALWRNPERWRLVCPDCFRKHVGTLR